ncbi:TPA: hypothetical protein NV949_004657, partial [Escherichia coli]|nr:hypothetical protein [Escherichia coli]
SELMEAIAEIGQKIATLPPIPDPMANNTAKYVDNDLVEPNFTYDNAGGFVTNTNKADQYSTLGSRTYSLGDYKFQATYTLPSYYSTTTTPYWWFTLIGYWGSPFRKATLELVNGNTFRFLITYDSFDKKETFVWATLPVGIDFFKKPFTVTIDRKRAARTIELTITQDSKVVLHSLMDMNNPPAEFATRFTQLGIASTLDRNTDFRFRHISSIGDKVS